MDTPSSSVKPKLRKKDNDEVRAERKRIQDRLAQRATRERTKNRIAYLEQRLRNLEAGDKAGEIASLTKIIDSVRQDNNRLRNAMVKIRTAIDQAVLTTEDEHPLPSSQIDLDYSQIPFDQPTVSAELTENIAPDEQPTTSRRQNSVSTGSDVTEVVNGHYLHPIDAQDITMEAATGSIPGADEAETSLTGLEDFFAFSPTSLLEAFELGPTGWSSAVPSLFDSHFPRADPVTSIAPDVDKWHVSNGAFIGCLDSVKKKATSTTTLDLHVPFKAVIWGWDNVGAEAQHPVWQALRQVDQQVFGTWTSTAQRIALMYVCQTLIQYRENPSKENLERVPVFLRPRPSQERVQHPAVIDFLVWPGLRDRLVFEHKKYTSTGTFSAAFVEYFNFYWPFSDRDIFAFNPQNNRYEVSRVFLEYAYDFKNWTMKPGFFKKFPEMQHDIAAFEETGSFG
ncbi:hypothetical protein LTR84_008588 [Exophiala bonariae]|uniref:BZIP domain-containing protein n=1 Tax=Exophiala bonariae TaxID=1690606 RepID=A0AAV9MXE3_9EURO|nr:hypothetical protein LTR84_008588 [Exophiala bonariae]